MARRRRIDARRSGALGERPGDRDRGRPERRAASRSRRDTTPRRRSADHRAGPGAARPASRDGAPCGSPRPAALDRAPHQRHDRDRGRPGTCGLHRRRRSSRRSRHRRSRPTRLDGRPIGRRAWPTDCARRARSQVAGSIASKGRCSATRRVSVAAGPGFGASVGPPGQAGSTSAVALVTTARIAPQPSEVVAQARRPRSGARSAGRGRRLGTKVLDGRSVGPVRSHQASHSTRPIMSRTGERIGGPPASFALSEFVASTMNGARKRTTPSQRPSGRRRAAS